MPEPERFDKPIRDFLTFARVEAVLATATIEAYRRDLGDLCEDWAPEGSRPPGGVRRRLADHAMAGPRTHDAGDLRRPALATIRVFFR